MQKMLSNLLGNLQFGLPSQYWVSPSCSPRPITWHPHELTPSEVNDWLRAGWVFPVKHHCRIGKITLKQVA